MKAVAESHKTVETLASDLSKLMEEVEHLLNDSTSNHAEEKIELLRSRFTQAQDRLGSLYTNARRKLADGARATDETIRSHPYESIGIALGLGVLLGAVFARRSR